MRAGYADYLESPEWEAKRHHLATPSRPPRTDPEAPTRLLRAFKRASDRVQGEKDGRPV